MGRVRNFRPRLQRWVSRRFLGAFNGVGAWVQLACGRVVLDGPFNPTYGLSLKS